MKGRLTIPGRSRKASVEDEIFEPIHTGKKKLNKEADNLKPREQPYQKAQKSFLKDPDIRGTARSLVRLECAWCGDTTTPWERAKSSQTL